MEHRWGQRIVLDRPVRLTGAPLAPVIGRLGNLSLSGAWISTSLVLVPGALVQVSVEHDGQGGASGSEVEAYVVRCDGLGIGIEWCELAPDAVLQWLHDARRFSALTSAG